MSTWVVTREGTEFAVEDLPALERLAREGQIFAGDLVRAPHSAGWQYAADVPELVGLIPDPFIGLPHRAPRWPWLLPALFLAIGFIVLALRPAEEPPPPAGWPELMVIADVAPLRAEPSLAEPAIAQVPRATRLEMRAKGQGFYRISLGDAVAWVATRDVIPAYQADGAPPSPELDALFHPDRHLWLSDPSWTQPRRGVAESVLQLGLTNDSAYWMTGVVLEVRFRDARGQDVQRRRLVVEGGIPARDGAAIGTLDARTDVARVLTSHEMARLRAADPTVDARWTEGVLVPLDGADFAEATVHLVELQAVEVADAPATADAELARRP